MCTELTAVAPPGQSQHEATKKLTFGMNLGVLLVRGRGTEIDHLVGKQGAFYVPKQPGMETINSITVD